LAKATSIGDLFYLFFRESGIKNRKESKIPIKIINKKLNQLNFSEFINIHKIYS